MRTINKTSNKKIIEVAGDIGDIVYAVNKDKKIPFSIEKATIVSINKYIDGISYYLKSLDGVEWGNPTMLVYNSIDEAVIKFKELEEIK